MESNIEDVEKFPCVSRVQFEKLGTDIDIRIVVDNSEQEDLAEKNLQEVRSLYDDFDEIFSRFDSKSELSKLNNLIGKFNPASEHMCEIASLCLAYNKKTQGLYDPRVLDVLEKIGYVDDFKSGSRVLGDNLEDNNSFFGSNLTEDLKVKDGSVLFGTRMDFSGIAKGYITDQIVKLLMQKNWENFLVDSGGDMFMQGFDEDGKKWTVGVEGIAENKLIFALDKKGIATSGIGRRRWEIEGKRLHHIINPKNSEQFSFDLKSVSVISDSTTDSDVWAKTLFLMGRESGILYAKEHNLAAVILDYRGSAWISPKAKEFIS